MQHELYKTLKVLNSQACCTYHATTDRYQVHIWGKPISDMHERSDDAMKQAISNLTKDILP